jgi:hypothetical protein
MRYLAASLVTGLVRAEIPFADVSYDLPLNDHGSFTGSVPYRSPVATPDILDPGGTVIYVINDGGHIEWTGILWTTSPDDSRTKLQCNAQELGSYFVKRFITTSVTYPDVDQLIIARSLIVNAQAVTGGGVGIIAYDSNTCGVTQYKDLHDYEAPEVMQTIKDLAEHDKGFDWEFYAEITGPTTIQRYFRTYFPRKGHRTNNVLELGTNAVVINHNVDASELANSVIGLGNGEGSSMIRSTSIDSSQFSRYPLLEKVASYKDVNFQSELQSRTDVDLGIAKKPVLNPTIELREHPSLPWGVINRGDDVYVRGNDGFLSINGYFRVQKVSVSISGGARKTTIDTVDADAFTYGQIPVDMTQPVGYPP